jgi:3-methyladenine DNA glycosylase AlkD
MMNANEVITFLKQKSNPANLAGMSRYGIDVQHALGIPIPELRKLAGVIKRDHALALELWATGFHEARILASMIDDPALVTSNQIDSWVKEFDSWDVCDQVCSNLFDHTPFALEKAIAFSANEEEFIKRAGFVLMAVYAVHNKTAKNDAFIDLLPIIECEAWDNRNFVKKAVNWALRQIGKRNDKLKIAALESANRILLQNSKAAKWIAADAIKELTKKPPVK